MCLCWINTQVYCLVALHFLFFPTSFGEMNILHSYYNFPFGMHKKTLAHTHTTHIRKRKCFYFVRDFILLRFLYHINYVEIAERTEGKMAELLKRAPVFVGLYLEEKNEEFDMKVSVRCIHIPEILSVFFHLCVLSHWFYIVPQEKFLVTFL